jgi:hypothetical protein
MPVQRGDAAGRTRGGQGTRQGTRQGRGGSDREAMRCWRLTAALRRRARAARMQGVAGGGAQAAGAPEAWQAPAAQAKGKPRPRRTLGHTLLLVLGPQFRQGRLVLVLVLVLGPRFRPRLKRSWWATVSHVWGH